MNKQKSKLENYPLTEYLTPEEYLLITTVFGIEVELADILFPLPENGKIRVKANCYRQILKIFN